MSVETNAARPAPLRGKRIAALVTDGFEQSELLGPRDALTAAGAQVDIVSPKAGSIRGWKDSTWSDPIDVDVSLDAADSRLYDALLIPGGVINSDTLRLSHRAIEFVRHFIASGKPVGAICHAAWLLIEAEAVEGVTLTSYASLKTDLLNAGALWIDKPVVIDKGIVTSRHPGDISDFASKLTEEISEGLQGDGAARAA